MRFSTSAFAPACTSPNHCEADPLRLYPDASDGEAAVTRYRVFPGMELDGVPDKLTALDAVLGAQGRPVK